MKLKLLVMSIFTLILITSSDTVYADTLCINVFTKDRSPAIGASVTLRTHKIFTDRRGNVCFQGISAGRYQVVVQWNKEKSRCSVDTSEQNTCFVQ
jgi:hypothetical protein